MPRRISGASQLDEKEKALIRPVAFVALVPSHPLFIGRSSPAGRGAENYRPAAAC
jgi:hypothetical protein